MVDPTTHPTPDQPLLTYSPQGFARARRFVFQKWCELAQERRVPVPVDLSGSCKYGSLFMQRVFGGSIEGHYQHQYNRIGGYIVDLSHDALDVGRIQHPYLHEPEFFAISETLQSRAERLPRVDAWAREFLAEMASETTP